MSMLLRFLRPCLFAAAAMGLAAGLAASPASAEGAGVSLISPAQRGEIETIVKEYLLTHPDVLRDALAEMERHQKAEDDAARSKAVAAQASLIFNSPHQAVLGNPNGKVTLVEFFDYNCGFCKKTLGDMARLLKQEPELRLVIKDFPVLGPGSVEAAHIATALRNQFSGEKYWQYHYKLLSTRGVVGKAQALAVARDLGADMDKLVRDANAPATTASINEVMQIADALQLTGTPSFVLADDVVVGAVGYDALKEKVDNVMKCGKTACG
jgi:protein-disulfide isomerase